MRYHRAVDHRGLAEALPSVRRARQDDRPGALPHRSFQALVVHGVITQVVGVAAVSLRGSHWRTDIARDALTPPPHLPR